MEGLGGLGRLASKHDNNVCALSLLKKYNGGYRYRRDLASYGGGVWGVWEGFEGLAGIALAGVWEGFEGLAGIALARPWVEDTHTKSPVSNWVSIFRNIFRFGRK